MTLSAFRLTSACLPQQFRASFDEARIGQMKDGTKIVVACGLFVIQWDVDMVQRGETFPQSIKRYADADTARLAWVKKIEMMV